MGNWPSVLWVVLIEEMHLVIDVGPEIGPQIVMKLVQNSGGSRNFWRVTDVLPLPWNAFKHVCDIDINGGSTFL